MERVFFSWDARMVDGWGKLDGKNELKRGSLQEEKQEWRTQRKELPSGSFQKKNEWKKFRPFLHADWPVNKVEI